MVSIKKSVVTALSLACLAGWASAQPTITSLGSGTPTGVTNGATRIVGGNGQIVQWVKSGSTFTQVGLGGGNSTGLQSTDGSVVAGAISHNPATLYGNSATGISPAFSIPGSFTQTLMATTANTAGRWNGTSWQTIPSMPNDAFSQSVWCFGFGSSTNIADVRAISADGRFVAGQTYVSTFSTAGTAINYNNTFRFRGYVYDNNTGTTQVLPTLIATAGTRYRDGRALAISADGTVVLGAQDPGTSSTTDSANPDGGRPIVYRYNAGTGHYDPSFLPDGVRASGNPFLRSVDGFYMNQAGTIIVGMSQEDVTGTRNLARWTWNAGTSTWDRQLLGSGFEVPPSWPGPEITGCGLPPTLNVTGMSDDGNTIVGYAQWSTCGSFQYGGWVYTEGTHSIQDWYDYCVAAGIPDITTQYSPIDVNNNPVSIGLPRLGYPSCISPDGNAIAGFQGGTQIIPIAVPWVIQNSGGSSCVAPYVTTNPTGSVLISRCSSFILNARAGGTLPITYQWYHNGSPMTDGPTGTGSTVTGAGTSQLRIAVPGNGEVGTFYCVATGCSGQTAQTTTTTATLDPAHPVPANDTCSTATNVGEGTFTFDICGAVQDDGYSPFIAPGSVEYGDVWYRYTPTFTGQARFQTCGSAFNTSITLFDSCGGAALDGNDDVGSRGLVGTSCSSQRSLVSRFNVTQGVPVYVRVGAVGQPFTGTGSLAISQAPSLPTNDECESAQPISVGTYTFNLAEATEYYTFGCTGGSTTSNRDVWFMIDPGCGGNISINTCGSTITNPMLHVMDGCYGNIIACNDNVGSGVSGCTSNQARILNLDITGPVFVRVSASGSSVPNSGAGVLNVTGYFRSMDYNQDGGADTGDVLDLANDIASATQSFPPNTSDFNNDGGADFSDVIDLANAIASGGVCP